MAGTAARSERCLTPCLLRSPVTRPSLPGRPRVTHLAVTYLIVRYLTVCWHFRRRMRPLWRCRGSVPWLYLWSLSWWMMLIEPAPPGSR